MGAQGVHLGTRFIATVENHASLVAKRAIVEVKSQEMIGLEGGHERTIPSRGGVKAYQPIKRREGSRGCS